jgi:superfamily II DNA or RNA helicase
MLILRGYQEELKQSIKDAWNIGHRNVLAQLPTGMGKTKCFVSLTMDIALNGSKLPTAIMVHRKELVQQISLTLAEEEVPHNIIAPRGVILGIVAAHRRMFRKQHYDYNAPITVVSVDTLNARILKHEKWAKSIKLWITDEAAHLLKNN